ncbi:FtsK/SpoIIIE domain-containing protein [Clostridium akagii]|uniref:FtsK/SpoIIIE domain-containing protein n=1 Tax=Clostridium akagii TaxID=91623 RepID=UPI000479A42F|nr:FtsK/SpoIIIE domain-containing protein [Clostridium akagii]
MNENQLNSEIENMLVSIFKAVGNFFKSAFLGIKKLKELPFFIGFLVSILITIVAVCFKVKIKTLTEVHSIIIYYVVYYGLLIMPVIYLNFIGKFNSNSKNEELFKKVDFKNKDGSYPYLVKKQVIAKGDGKIINYIFSSSLNLDIWKGRKSDIETALNCTIIKIEQGKKKTLINIEAIPGNVKVDEFVPWKDEFLINEDGVVAIGKNQLGVIQIDLNKTPHVLAAGETGSGKSVILRCILWQFILKGCRVYMLDFKGGVEFGLDYEKYGEVITEKERALEVLKLLTTENVNRLELFRAARAKNLAEYNSKENTNLCRIGVFVDELAELMDKTGADKEEKEMLDQIQKEVSSLARLSRATGINLILGIQRPDAKVITGQIKNNVPVRICGRFADASASEIVLNNRLATNLPEIKGRFLYKAGAETLEFQAYYFDDDKNLKDIETNQGTMLIEQSEDKEDVEKVDTEDVQPDKDEKIDTADIKLNSLNPAKKESNKKDKFNFHF